MLENSYDASGIKFGIVFSPLLPNYGDKICKETLVGRGTTIEIICKEESIMIDFSNFDGLTPIEIINICQGLQSQKVIVFAVYNAINIQNHKGHKEGFVYIADYVPIIVDDKSCNVPIDELIVNYYLNNYNELGYKGKKQARCFLQRYRYETKERTDEILKEKVYKKEDNM